VREPVLKTLGEVASRNLSFDYVAIKPEHTKNVATVAKRHPNLTIIIDHFAKPDIKGGQWDEWLVEMQKAAAFPNVYTKFSGLNVLSDWEKWTIEDWRPYVMAMKEAFGTSRMMMGSDWPFSSMANDYDTVWKAQLELIKDFSQAEIDDLKYKTAIKAYRL
jgi:L-fuconolactonase